MNVLLGEKSIDFFLLPMPKTQANTFVLSIKKPELISLKCFSKIHSRANSPPGNPGQLTQ